MRETKRNRKRNLCLAINMVGNGPDSFDSYVYIQRLNGETIHDLMDGVLRSALALGGGDGLGVHEGGNEIVLKTGEILEAVGFGVKKDALSRGAYYFAESTARLIASWTERGDMKLGDGKRLPLSELDLYEYR